MIYLLLYIEFFKIGLFAIGGGLATIPFLYELAERTSWFSTLDLTNTIALAQAIPGPLGINMASFAGYNTVGFFGVFVAVAGLTSPALISIVLIAKFIEKFKDNLIFQNAFSGIRPAVCGLLVISVWEIFKVSLISTEALSAHSGMFALPKYKSLIFFALLLGLSFKLKIHPFFYILLSAVVGLFIKF